MTASTVESNGLPLSIAFVITRSDTIGGAHVHVRDLAIALTGIGYRVRVFVGGSGMYVSHLQERGVEVHCLPSLDRDISPYRDLNAMRELRRGLGLFQPDLVSTHSSKAGWLGRLVARTMGLPVLFTAHGWSFSSGVPQPTRSVYAVAEAIASRISSSIVTVCDYDKRLAERWRVIPPHRACTIHNGVPDISQGQQASPAGAPPRIVMTARFDAPKDHDTLLSALAGVRGVEYGVDLIGDGPGEERAYALAESLGLLPRVRFLGQLADVGPYLAAAHIFVLVSDWEGFPRSILEAMRAGLPVVATKVGGVSEAVTPRETGFLVRRGDAEDLRIQLCRLLASPSLRARMGYAGRRRYEGHFTFERLLADTVSVYQTLVPTRRSGRSLPGFP